MSDVMYDSLYYEGDWYAVVLCSQKAIYELPPEYRKGPRFGVSNPEGYGCTYRIAEDTLFLDKVYTFYDVDGLCINGVYGMYNEGRFLFPDIEMPVTQFTGKIMIGKDLNVEEKYYEYGPNLPRDYDTIHSIDIVDGKVVKVKNLWNKTTKKAILDDFGDEFAEEMKQYYLRYKEILGDLD